MIITNIKINAVPEIYDYSRPHAYHVSYAATVRLDNLSNVEMHNLRQMLGCSVDVVATRNDLPPYEFMPTKTFQKPIESKPRKIVNAILELEI